MVSSRLCIQISFLKQLKFGILDRSQKKHVMVRYFKSQTIDKHFQEEKDIINRKSQVTK